MFEFPIWFTVLKILLDVVVHFLCFPNLQMRVEHVDNHIFRLNPKATSLALFARVCFLRFSLPRVEGFLICRLIFKSQVKRLLKACAFSQPREDMKIKTDQSLNACPATYVGVKSKAVLQRLHK